MSEDLFMSYDIGYRRSATQEADRKNSDILLNNCHFFFRINKLKRCSDNVRKKKSFCIDFFFFVDLKSPHGDIMGVSSAIGGGRPH